MKKVDERVFYLGERLAPMHSTFPLGLLGSTRTSLVPSVGSKALVYRLELGASTATASLMTVSSFEVIVAVAGS
jgi:hypothetical protein